MRDAKLKYFDPKPESVGPAREFITRTLAAWGLDGPAEDIRLCVSELATNALLHGTGSGLGFLVRLAVADDFVRLEVHDRRPHGGGAPRPRLRRPAETDSSGRGLLIVEMLAEDWGVDEREPSGTIVWSRFKAAPGDSAEVRR
jgi:anti-sigma regulatory factor (Ser/Thr protein kinase)